jgi:hypothetical protein
MIGVSFLICIGIWGWQRFLADFWPLDSSRVGPNLIASFVTVVLITAHNEGRVVQQGIEHHKDFKETVQAMLAEVMHPVEVFQDSVADAVAEALDADEPLDPDESSA